MSIPLEVPEDIVERTRALCLALPEVTSCCVPAQKNARRCCPSASRSSPREPEKLTALLD